MYLYFARSKKLSNNSWTNCQLAAIQHRWHRSSWGICRWTDWQRDHTICLSRLNQWCLLRRLLWPQHWTDLHSLRLCTASFTGRTSGVCSWWPYLGCPYCQRALSEVLYSTNIFSSQLGWALGSGFRAGCCHHQWECASNCCSRLNISFERHAF